MRKAPITVLSAHPPAACRTRPSKGAGTALTSMTTTTPAVIPAAVIGGVDTHGNTHHAAVIDHLGRHLADHELPTSPAGYRHLLTWLSGHGELDRVDVEGIGTYGAALARHPHQHDITVVEVDRPDRKSRRANGKSDRLDAYSAAGRADRHPVNPCRRHD